MIETLTAILDLIVTLVKTIINTLSAFLALVANIPSQLAFLTTSIASLPPFVIPYALSFVTFTLLTWLIGKKVE